MTTTTEFRAVAQFYSLGSHPCRRVLELERVGAVVKKPDLVVIMTNPGGAEPEKGYSSDWGWVPTKIDDTLERIILLMNQCNMDSARVLNLFDVCCTNTQKLGDFLKTATAEAHPYSIFDVRRETDLERHLAGTERAHFVVAWGVNGSVIRKTAYRALDRLNTMSLSGWQHSSLGAWAYYHPLPRDGGDRTRWIENVAAEIAAMRIKHHV